MPSLNDLVMIQNANVLHFGLVKEMMMNEQWVDKIATVLQSVSSDTNPVKYIQVNENVKECSLLQVHCFR